MPEIMRLWHLERHTEADYDEVNGFVVWAPTEAAARNFIIDRHLFGDEVLIRVADLMKKSFRGNDKLFRFGGEEFCVLLRNCNADQAMQKTELLVKKFSESVIRLTNDLDVQVTISAGVHAHASEHSLLKTIQSADTALYAAKHGGRNQVQRL